LPLDRSLRAYEIVVVFDSLIWRVEAFEMDKAIKAVQLLTLILVSLVCLAYIWRQYYDYRSRQEAWGICYKWAYDEAKILSKSEVTVIQECMERIKP
jgi:hypothetical protein